MGAKSGNSAVIYDTQLIEIFIKGGSTRTKFRLPDAPDLRFSKILGARTYFAENVPESILSAGTPVISGTDAGKIFVTFQDYAGVNFMQQRPLVSFNTMTNNSNTENFPAKFCMQEMNYPKSYIEFVSSADVPDEDTSVLFEIYYLRDKGSRKKSKHANFNRRR